MDAIAIQKAIKMTKADLARDFEGLEPKEIPSHINPRFQNRKCIVADALFTLGKIPILIAGNKVDKALYALGGVHAALWSVGAMSRKQIEDINLLAADVSFQA